MIDHLEQNGEDNEAEVGPSDKLPGEAIEEANLVSDNGGWARFLAERASTVRNLSVVEEYAIGWDWVLARDSNRVQLAWCHSQCRSEVNVGETVRGAVVPEEVQEGN